MIYRPGVAAGVTPIKPSSGRPVPRIEEHPRLQRTGCSQIQPNHQKAFRRKGTVIVLLAIRTYERNPSLSPPSQHGTSIASVSSSHSLGSKNGRVIMKSAMTFPLRHPTQKDM